MRKEEEKEILGTYYERRQALLAPTVLVKSLEGLKVGMDLIDEHLLSMQHIIRR